MFSIFSPLHNFFSGWSVIFLLNHRCYLQSATRSTVCNPRDTYNVALWQPGLLGDKRSFSRLVAGSVAGAGALARAFLRSYVRSLCTVAIWKIICHAEAGGGETEEGESTHTLVLFACTQKPRTRSQTEMARGRKRERERITHVETRCSRGAR